MMKRGLLAVAASVVVVGAAAGLASARDTATVAMRARLTVVKLAAPKLPSASGHFAGSLLRYSNGRSKLSWTLAYKNVGARAKSAQLLIPATKKQPAISIQLCRRCKLSGHGVVSPILKLSTKALLTRRGYVVVTTKKYPKGAIRGRLVRSR
jgi:hypothetical protein